MPRYDYECPEHGVQEVTHGMSDPGPIRCKRDRIPENQTFGIPCDKEMKRVYVPQNVVYKGNGFYTTDSRTIRSHSDVM